jgi:hypothetical protein
MIAFMMKVLKEIRYRTWQRVLSEKINLDIHDKGLSRKKHQKFPQNPDV